MINNVILVGMVVGSIKKIKLDGKQYAYIFIQIDNNKKTIQCLLNDILIEDAIDNICECQHIGIKGHIDIINNKQEIIIDTITLALKKEV